MSITDGPQPALALHHIDLFARFGRVLQVIGWSELADAKSGFCAEIWIESAVIRGDVRFAERPDLAAIYGEHARYWGFDALLVLPTPEIARAACAARLVLTSTHGQTVIGHPGASFGRLHDSAGTALEEKFFAAVRAHDSARVLEIGSRARSGISRGELFSGCEYVGVDICAGDNVDVVADVHELSKRRIGRFDFVFSVSVFEHLLMPWKVAVELAKIMNQGGLVFLQTHQAWALHDVPWDFWRFSRESWQAIFNSQTGFEIIGTAYKQPCLYVSAFDTGSPVIDHGFKNFGYYTVVCLAKKIGEPKVEWPATLSQIIETKYPA